MFRPLRAQYILADQSNTAAQISTFLLDPKKTNTAQDQRSSHVVYTGDLNAKVGSDPSRRRCLTTDSWGGGDATLLETACWIEAQVGQVWPLTQFFLFSFCKKIIDCLEGKSMTPL